MNRSRVQFFPSLAIVLECSAPPPALQSSKRRGTYSFFIVHNIKSNASSPGQFYSFHLRNATTNQVRRIWLAVSLSVASTAALAGINNLPFPGNPSCATQRLPNFRNLKVSEAAQNKSRPRLSCPPTSVP